jgi:hypothetical protein
MSHPIFSPIKSTCKKAKLILQQKRAQSRNNKQQLCTYLKSEAEFSDVTPWHLLHPTIEIVSPNLTSAPWHHCTCYRLKSLSKTISILNPTKAWLKDENSRSTF